MTEPRAPESVLPDRTEGTLSPVIASEDAATITNSVETTVLRIKALGALKSGNTDEINALLKSHPEIVKQDPLFLNTAVQIASLETIQWLLNSEYASNINLNAADANGNTPLHLAAMYDRQELAVFLLSRRHINDTLLNENGHQPVEEAKTPQTAEAMQIARARYVEHIAGLMRKYLDDENTDALDELLSLPRASSLLDINGQDPETGTTILHEYVKRKNRKMVEFILDHGGDPFRRDTKGVLPIDIAKDESIKKLLKSARKDQAVISTTGGSAAPTGILEPPAMKGYLKKWTNITGGYKLRWFVLEQGVLSYYKKQDDTERACRGSVNLRQARLHLDSSEKLRFEILIRGSNTKFHLKGNHPVETNRWVWAIQNAIQYCKDQEKKAKSLTSASTSSLLPPQTHSRASSLRKVPSTRTNSGDDEPGPPPSPTRSGYSPSVTNSRFIDDVAVNTEDEFEDDEDEGDEGSEAGGSELGRMPYGRLESSVTVEISAIRELLNVVQTKSDASNLSKEDVLQTTHAISDCLETIGSLTSQYVQSSMSQEQYFTRRLERAEVKERLWIQNLRTLQVEYEKIQGSLAEALQKQKEAKKKLREAQAEGKATSGVPIVVIGNQGSTGKYVDTDEDDDDDDVFFDVNDGSQTEQETIYEEPEPKAAHEPTTAKSGENLTKKQESKKEIITKENSFAGYEEPPRAKLLLNDDDRPKISLWGVLKSLIGKDMTRMTLPVSFNECTNLLQRSAEDMEYTDILDRAAKITDDPALRLAHVAAFAASSYSSTTNRIAKPFNPLLGETFEYCRPDLGYRLFSEQVSHHPPVGAMLAESAKWDFYGQSNVKSKFNGRSFDINPLGRWYVVLRPDPGAQVEEELYSFRKVTSSVVGIITGSPVVDNYGPMEVVNHTLGYKCQLEFKARGWRGGGAYELKGTVMTPSGQPEWVVGGKWNDRIVAKKVSGDGTGTPGIDSEDQPPLSGEQEGSQRPNRILLWKVHERPSAPFNLTPFAITLNALPTGLKEWVAPTDTRLRPDQRAMEEGRYDDASTEKVRVEEKQRAVRREREAKGESYKPLWFRKSKHPVTGEEYYEVRSNYWDARKSQSIKTIAPDIF